MFRRVSHLPDSLVVRLLMLIVAVTIPFLALCAYSIEQIDARDRGRAGERLLIQAQDRARLLDHRFQAIAALGRSLAGSSALARGDLDAFRHDLASASAALDGMSVALVDRTATVMLSAGIPFDAARLGPRAAALVEQTIGTNRTGISGLIPITGREETGILVSIPVPVADPALAARTAVTVMIPRGWLRATLLDGPLPAGWGGAILGPSGTMVARASREVGPAGEQPRSELLQLTRSGGSGLSLAGIRNPDGVRSMIAFARASESGFVAVLCMPEREFVIALKNTMLQTLAVGLLLIGAGLVTAFLLSRRIVAALHRVSDAVPGSSVRTGLSEVDTLSRQLAEAAAEQARAVAELRALFRASPIGIVQADANGRVWEANDAYLDIVGMTRAELDAGQVRWTALTPPEYRLRDEAAIAEAAARGACTPYEKEYQRPDGRRVPVLVAFSFSDPVHGRTACFVVDLTEQKRAAVAVRRSEARFLRTVEAARLGIWDWDLVADRIDFSPGGHERLLYDRPTGSLGTADRLVAAIHPDDRQAFRAAIAQVQRPGGADDFGIEYRVPLGDEAVRWLRVQGRVTARDAGNRATRLSGAAMDVTERRAAEETLRRLTATLEARVREEVAAREVAQAQAAHADRMQALGLLAAGIAHDFNNVLQAVTGAAARIERRPDHIPTVRRMALVASEAAARGASITGRLLNFARRDNKRVEPVDPIPLLIQMGEMLAATLGKAIRVTTDLPDAVPAILVDKGELGAVLVNLAANARDAMPEGGTLTLSVDVPRQQGPEGLPPGRHVRIAVTDTGTGMDAATLAQVTELFYTTKPPGKGTGLGLPMARAFAEQSRGALRIESVPGQGTTVSLWLPLADAAATPDDQPGPRPGCGARRVLLIDPDGRTLHDTLETAGLSVLPEADAERAMARLRGSGTRVDLIVANLPAHERAPATLLRQARSLSPDLPVLLISDSPAHETPPEIRSDRCVRLMRSPVDGSRLVDEVLALLSVSADG